MKDVTFGQYYPADSIVHRLDPRTKLLFTFFYIVAIFFIKSPLGYAGVAVYAVAIIFAARIPVRTVLKSLKAVIFLLLFTMILNVFFYKDGEVLIEFWKIKITVEGLFFSFTMALRLILLVMGTSLLTFTTTPTALTDAIEGLLKPLKYIGINVHDLAVIMSIALRFIPSIQEETEKIISAQKARGAEFDTGNIFKKAKAMLPILIPLFISSFRRADELALALDARCYNLSDKRTKMKILKYKKTDFAALFYALLFVGLIVADRIFLVNIDIIGLLR
ncbi:MAG: energy-coupling factor transporter transmembrane protein EcfT [Clostridiales bacterium]|jgi:energy-coupling factor transport system permease protein|nr:energy-coupling factor transporter transmembrane protein EcfT [Clostridiales bacterium]